MKNRIWILVILAIFLIGTGVPSYFWIKTGDMLSGTRLELKTSETTLAATKESLTLVQTERDFAKDELEKARKSDPLLFLPPPEIKNRLEFDSLYTLLQTRFPGTHIFTRSSVKIISKEDWLKFLKLDRINETPYSWQDFNCTEYAEILQGNARKLAPASAFGIAIVVRTGIDQPGHYHYMNFFLDENGIIWLVEPQNDSIFLPPTDWQYLLILI